MKKIDRFLLKISKGYTLLELLVVIGLITILMSFGAASYSTAQQKARDSKRKSDLRTLQNALEQYYSVCSYKYPAFADGAAITGVTACAAGGGKVILSNLADPMGNSYKCSGTCDVDQYIICPSVLAGSPTRYLETDTTCTTSNKTCCIKNQQ